MQLKGNFTAEYFFGGSFHSINFFVKQGQTLIKCNVKTFFLAFYDFLNELTLFNNFRKNVTHCINNSINQFIYKRSAHIEIPTVARSAPQNAAEDISPAFIAWYSAIANRKSECANVICNYIHGRFKLSGILFTGNTDKLVNKRQENIRKIVR